MSLRPQCVWGAQGTKRRMKRVSYFEKLGNDAYGQKMCVCFSKLLLAGAGASESVCELAMSIDSMETFQSLGKSLL